jgi:hypothetical protein
MGSKIYLTSEKSLLYLPIIKPRFLDHLTRSLLTVSADVLFSCFGTKEVNKTVSRSSVGAEYHPCQHYSIIALPETKPQALLFGCQDNAPEINPCPVPWKDGHNAALYRLCIYHCKCFLTFHLCCCKRRLISLNEKTRDIDNKCTSFPTIDSPLQMHE